MTWRDFFKGVFWFIVILAGVCGVIGGIYGVFAGVAALFGRAGLAVLVILVFLALGGLVVGASIAADRAGK